jgi:flagellar biosynthesis/type III secretory pathway M-ring protein FliF/YscJ
MVSTAVRGLQPKNVSVVDNYGNLIEGDKGDETVAKASTFMEHQKNIEREKIAKIEKQLNAWPGPDNFRVTVDVELEHVQRTTEEKTVDRDSKVPIRESMQSESSDMGKAAAVPAGIGIPASVGRAGGGSTKKMTEEVDYAFDQKRSVIVEIPGEPKRISVAAVVNLPEDPDNPAEVQKQLDKISKTIKGAINYVEGRDVVSVQNVPFLPKQEEDVVLDEQTTTEFYLELGKRISLGLLVLGALAAVWITTAPRRREARAQAQLAAAEARALEAPKTPALEDGQHALQGRYDAEGNLLGYEEEVTYDDEDDSPEAVAYRKRRQKLLEAEEEDIGLEDLPDDAPMSRKVAVVMRTKPERVKQLFRSWVESEDEGEE